jgi:prepilin-type N-terminal cleavage/methylation domain-containing protein
MKNNKGFTLVEVIISIGALGIICAVLLRLFVLAGATNDRAADRQAAEMAAASAAETLLCAGSLDDGLSMLGAVAIDADGGFEAAKNGFTLSLRVSPRGEYPGTLFDVCVQASREGDVLAEINTVKYYPEDTP